MARASTSVLRLAQGADRFADRPFRFVSDRPRVKATVVAMLVVAAVAAALIPVRDSIGTANIGLALALVVGAAGTWAGPSSGLVTALWAGIAFTFLHAVPHGLPRIEEEQDLLTAALLLVTGVLAGWLHRRLDALTDRVAVSSADVTRLHRMAEGSIKAETTDEIMAIACDALAAELGLESCRWEADAATGGLRQLRHNAAIQGTRPETSAGHLGAIMVEGVAISTGTRGQFVLVGRRGAEPSRHQLKTAIVMADIATAAAQLTGQPD